MTKEEELEISLSKTIVYYEKRISELNHQNMMLYASAFNSKEHAKQLALTEKALELACEELYDSDSISVCSYCPYNLTAECPDICPSDKHILTEYFKTKAKEMMKSE
jgi:hypothetical protein